MPIHITDMGRCTPTSAISSTAKKHRWLLLNYEAEGFAGTMLAAEELTDAPEVTLPLGVTGWHEIRVGFWNPNLHYVRQTVIKLKLTGDACFRTIRHKPKKVCWTGMSLHEVAWAEADLTGRDLIIAQRTQGRPAPAHVAYVKLVPLSAEQVEEVLRDRARTDTRKVVSLNDGVSFLDGEACTTAAQLLEQVELYRYSDVGTVFWAVNYGELTNYPSEVGTPVARTGEDALTPGEKNEMESLHTLISNGIVPFEAAGKAVHEMGLEFHAQFRLAILTGDFMTGSFPAGFSAEHPEFRMLDPDGTPLPKLSYAFPEVRQFMLTLMREIGAFDIDGVDLCFIRGPLFVGYEAPVVADFEKQYGQDPREMDQTDPRWLAHKAGYVTQFVREARQVVDEIAAARARPVKLSAMSYGSESLNMYFGLDVRSWLKEDLLDFIIAPATNPDLVKLIADSNCQHVAGVGAHTPENYVETALAARDIGAVGIATWDMNLLQDLPEHWAVLSRLGHDDEVDAFAKQLPKMKVIPLKTLGGMDVCHTCYKDSPGNHPPEMITLTTGG